MIKSRSDIKNLSILIFSILILYSIDSFGQSPATPKRQPSAQANTAKDGVRASAAYAEVLLRRTEIEAELEALLIDYTDDFPKVAELKYGLGRINFAADLLLAVKAADHEKLTLALGKLLVKRAEAEAVLNEISKTYKEGHPDHKRAKRRVEIYDQAINEILPPK